MTGVLGFKMSQPATKKCSDITLCDQCFQALFACWFLQAQLLLCARKLFWVGRIWATTAPYRFGMRLKMHLWGLIEEGFYYFRQEVMLSCQSVCLSKLWTVIEEILRRCPQLDREQVITFWVWSDINHVNMYWPVVLTPTPLLRQRAHLATAGADALAMPKYHFLKTDMIPIPESEFLPLSIPMPILHT